MTEFTSEWISKQRKYVVDNGCLNDQLCIELLDEIERLQARVQELEQERRWIPVSEKENLPDVGVEILGWEVRRQRYVLDWLANREMLSKKEPTFLFSFDYWLPLPQPPKEGK